jgi:hypothetical protein
MRVWAAHAIFATVLVGSLAGRERAAEAPISGAGFESAIVRVARYQDLGFREYRANTAGFTRVMVFDASGCSQPVLVIGRLATFEDEAVMEPAVGGGYEHKYVYIDKKWNSPEPRAISIQRMKYGFLAMFGLTEFAPSAVILQVETPRACQAAENIDWSQAWRRKYLVEANVAAPKH